MSEATPGFKRQLREAFEEMHTGQTFTFRRTFTDGDEAMSCGVSEDYNPTIRMRRSPSRASTDG